MAIPRSPQFRFENSGCYVSLSKIADYLIDNLFVHMLSQFEWRGQGESWRAAEKAELLDTVWESVEADAASLTDARRAELDYRIARHEQNPTDVMPWEQVRARLLKKP
jgi:putative addiction module component (TIGR02574 family)